MRGKSTSPLCLYLEHRGGRTHAHHIWWFYLKKTNILISAWNADSGCSKCEKQDLDDALLKTYAQTPHWQGLFSFFFITVRGGLTARRMVVQPLVTV